MKLDREEIKNLYIRMYEDMINKDINDLAQILDDNFKLIHMTGMKQSKKEYLQAIKNGTLNYYSAKHDDIKIEINEEKVNLCGDSYVLAAVFGGGKSYWNLRQSITLIKSENTWKMTLSKASTY